MPTLPKDDDGKLVPFTADQITAMQIKRRGITELDHVRYDFGPDGAGCTRKFSCKWSERFNALFYFAGAVTSYIDPVSGVRKLSRLVPQIDPDFDFWICTKVNITGYQFKGTITTASGSEGMPDFARAELECVYELVPWDVSDDTTAYASPLLELSRYVTLPGTRDAAMTADASYIGLPGSIVQYATTDGTTATGPAGTPIPFSVGFPEATNKFKIVWRRLPREIWKSTSALFLRLIGTETTRGYIGALNQTTFEGYTPLSLQLLGIEARLLPDPTGLDYSWDLAYVFQQAVKPYGHTGFYFHDTSAAGGKSGYYQVLRPAAGKTVIDAASLGDNDSLLPVREFANLFVPGA